MKIARLTDRLYRRLLHYRSVAELSGPVRRRLLDACEDLAREEEEMRRLLGLAATPRLSVVDEETATIVTPGGRKLLAGPD